VAKAVLIFLNRNSLPTVFIGRWQRILAQLPLLAGGKAAMVHEIPPLPPAFHMAGGKAGISKVLVCFFCFASQQSSHTSIVPVLTLRHHL